ncbi:MAG: PatB family C-S lyase [Clostridia bacterium]|nr:PatB family C-S lyase [Clostridia bacterium]
MDRESLIYIDRNGSDCVKWDGAKARFGESGLLPLWVADMDFQAPACVREAVASWAAHGAYGYYLPPDRYYRAFAQWELTHHGYAVQKEWLRTTPGVVPALYWLVQALTAPGDGVTVLKPVYYPFFGAIEDSGRKLLSCELVNENGRYSMDFDGLDAHFAATGSKLLIFSSPHNPVGRVWQRQELEQLCAVCEKHGVTVLSDEIHQDLIIGGNPHIPTATVHKGRTVTLTSASKTFNLAGLQNAFVVIPDEDLRQKYDALIRSLNCGSCPSVGYVAAAAAYSGGEGWLESLLERVDENYQAVCAEFNDRLPQAVISPLEGTYLLWIDLRRCLDPEKTKFIVQEVCGLAVDYGDWFGGDAYKGFIRINLATSLDNVMLATARLLAALTD